MSALQFQVVFIGDDAMERWPSDSIRDLCNIHSGACVNIATKGLMRAMEIGAQSCMHHAEYCLN